MRRLLKLYIMLRKNNHSGDSANAAKANAAMWGLIGLAASVALAVVCYKNADFVELLGGPFIIVLLTGLLVTMGVIGLGFFSLVTQMYMSSDIEVLITLPFSSIQIVVLRVLTFLRLALLASLGLTLIPTIGYALVCPISVRAWIGVVVTAIAVPTFSTALVAALVIVIMRILKVFQSRETLRIIGTGFLFLLLCFYMFFNSSDKSFDLQNVLLTVAEKGLDLKYLVPVIGFGLDFIAKGNVLYLGGELLCTLVMVAIFLGIAKTLYLHGAMSMQDAGRGKLLTEADMDKYCTQKKTMDALVAKEYRMVRRNPTYMLYNFIVGALWPILIVIAFKEVLSSFTEGMKGGLLSVIRGPLSFDGFAIATTIFVTFALAMVSLPLSMQTLGISSISREGKSFMIMKQIPVAYDVQIEAKRRMARNVAQVSISGYTVIIMIAAAILMKFSVLYCILPVLAVMLYTEMQVNANVAIGIKKANVSWDDEKAATRKPAPLVLLSTFAMLVFLIAGLVMLFALADHSLSPAIGLCIIVCLNLVIYALNVLFKHSIKKHGETVIRRLRF